MGVECTLLSHLARLRLQELQSQWTKEVLRGLLASFWFLIFVSASVYSASLIYSSAIISGASRRTSHVYNRPILVRPFCTDTSDLEGTPYWVVAQ